RIFGLDLVPGLDEHVDDVDFCEIPKLGDPHFDLAHGIASVSWPGSARISPRRVVKRTAFAPSMTRWSYDSDSGSISRGTNAMSRYTGCHTLRETPRMATSGALMIGVKNRPPMPPRLEIVNTPP